MVSVVPQLVPELLRHSAHPLRLAEVVRVASHPAVRPHSPDHYSLLPVPGVLGHLELLQLSTMCETYGLAKQGARHHGYTGQRGYHPLLAIAAGTGDVLMARLRWNWAGTSPIVSEVFSANYLSVVDGSSGRTCFSRTSPSA